MRPGPVEAFKQHGEDFVVADNLTDLVAGMNRVAGSSLITEESLRRTITERDRQLDNPFTKDTQVTSIRGHRNYRGDRLIRVAPPHKFLDPANGPLIAVRLQHPDPQDPRRPADRPRRAACSSRPATPLPGVYAAGEVAGFGGGGVHGYNALEGTFLGGCLFSGRTAGRAAAALSAGSPDCDAGEGRRAPQRHSHANRATRYAGDGVAVISPISDIRMSGEPPAPLGNAGTAV